MIRIECAIENEYGCYLRCFELENDSKVSDVLSLLDFEASSYILSIWGKKVTLGTVLSNNDRLEFNRPLQKDPLSRLDIRPNGKL